MLILRRKVGERLVINGEITVALLSVEGERVKIGISAPPEVSIVREELVRAEAEASRKRDRRSS